MIGVIIQARMSSTRLPGKAIKKIGNKTLLEHIFFRLESLMHKAQIILATTKAKKDDIINEFCMRHQIECFRGSEKDVLERYYKCAKEYNMQHIVRLTADNPFTDIEELDNLIELYLTENADYSNSFKHLPDGTGAEIFSLGALKKSYIEGNLEHHREHVNEYILEHPELFKIVNFVDIPANKERPDIRLTVDTLDDYKRVCYIVKNCNEYITTERAIHFAEMYEKSR